VFVGLTHKTNSSKNVEMGLYSEVAMPSFIYDSTTRVDFFYFFFFLVLTLLVYVIIQVQVTSALCSSSSCCCCLTMKLKLKCLQKKNEIEKYKNKKHFKKGNKRQSYLSGFSRCVDRSYLLLLLLCPRSIFKS
jgi:hypothetical protein